MQKAAPYVTKPEDVYCSVWVKDEASDLWFSREPLRDRSTGLYARLTWRGATDACAALGARLITADEVVALHEAAVRGDAIEPDPFTLPDAHLCAEASVQLDWEHHGAEVEALLTANMGGLAWAQYHDAELAKRVEALTAQRWLLALTMAPASDLRTSASGG